MHTRHNVDSHRREPKAKRSMLIAEDFDTSLFHLEASTESQSKHIAD